MISDYEITEFVNPCFPNLVHYQCTLENGTVYQSTDYELLTMLIIDYIASKAKYDRITELNDKACTAFMADVKIKD